MTYWNKGSNDLLDVDEDGKGGDQDDANVWKSSH